MNLLRIDIETYSDVNLKTDGLYKYAENCEIMLFGYRVDDEPIQCINLFTEEIPDEIFGALTDSNVIKTAYNAAFEIECISSFFNIKLSRSQWRCTMILSAVAGLPLKLEEVAKVLKVENKDKQGESLIQFFCKPCKATKSNGGFVRNLPSSYPEKWQAFINYCKTDVSVEEKVANKLAFINIPRNEQRLWSLDQRINHKGVEVDAHFVKNAIRMNKEFRQILTEEAVRITGLDNPNSRNQLIAWLQEETEDNSINNLKKDNIPVLLAKFDDERVQRVLSLRQQLSKTSVKKYTTMLKSLCRNGRVRGLLQFYGANRTWRWAGRLIQVHNLVKGIYSGAVLDYARNLVLVGDSDLLEFFFGSIPTTLSQLVRTAFVAPKGKRFIVSDYAQIEARLISWLAGEKWRMDVFASGENIYKATASKMFKVPIEQVTKLSDEYAKGKISELALGFGGGVPALLKMGAIAMGIPEDDLPLIVKTWRKENPMIVNLWKVMDSAAKICIRQQRRVYLTEVKRDGVQMLADGKGIYFDFKNGFMLIRLPSDRILYYPGAQLTPGQFGDDIRYFGVDQTTKKWIRVKSYGGKLVENVIQAMARDCLGNGLLNLFAGGYETVMHVHDETINECDDNFGTLEEVNTLMVKPAPWMGDLPLKAEGFESTYYKKD